MRFESVETIKTIIPYEKRNDCLNYICEHVMFFGDEIFYIMDGDELFGIVALGDLERHLFKGSRLINRYFQYVEDQISNFSKALAIFDTFHAIREIPVMNGKKLVGRLCKGERKNYREWDKYRLKLSSHFRGLHILSEEE